MLNFLDKSFKFLKEINKPIATIEEIHNEFDSASEKILKDAYAILEKESFRDKEEIQELKILGFLKINSVIELDKEEEQKSEANENVRLVNYYKKYYPNNKFINQSEIERICEKYGLICGLSNDYIGDIPPKNRREIINFRIKNDNDYRYTIKRVTEMLIVATPDKFDLKNKVISNYKLLVYDPVVLHPVRGGYLIVSKWGNEENLNELK